MTERLDFPPGIRVLLEQLDEQLVRVAEMVEEFKNWAEAEGYSAEYLAAVTLAGQPIIGLARRTGRPDERIALLPSWGSSTIIASGKNIGR